MLFRNQGSVFGMQAAKALSSRPVQSEHDYKPVALEPQGYQYVTRQDDATVLFGRHWPDEVESPSAAAISCSLCLLSPHLIPLCRPLPHIDCEFENVARFSNTPEPRSSLKATSDTDSSMKASGAAPPPSPPPTNRMEPHGKNQQERLSVNRD